MVHKSTRSHNKGIKREIARRTAVSALYTNLLEPLCLEPINQIALLVHPEMFYLGIFSEQTAQYLQIMLIF